MRRTVAALAACALAVPVGACGGAGGDGVAAAANVAELARTIGERTSETDTARFTFTADVSGQRLRGDGGLRFTADDAAMTMTMATPEGEISVVLLDNVFYFDLPREMEPGRTWVRVSPGDNSPMARALGGMTEQMSKNADPRAALAQFQKSGEITSTREEDLDGQPTTHVTITVNVRKLVDNQTDPAVKQAMAQAIERDFPVDLWVNEDDLPVRFAMDMPLGDPAGTGQNTGMTLRMDYTKWGEPVEIAAPPADQVAEIPAT